jgi:multiple sugar transport system ATP-binding protein
VEVKEPLGSEVLLDMKVGPKPVVARVQPSTTIRVGEQIRLSVDLAKIHLFDPHTERAIS